MGVFSNITRLKEAKDGMENADEGTKKSIFIRMALVIIGLVAFWALMQGVRFLFTDN